LTGKESRLTCVDDWATNQAELLFDKNIVNLKINKIKGKSQIVLPALISKNSKYNFIYVDADHHSSSVLRDLCLSWELLKSGGVIICDDYAWTHRKRNSSPKLAIDGWLICNKDIIDGYEIHYKDFNNAQCAIWKKQ
jgi:predicted O-methyltransferase YrrM